jgi:ABC-2 type transport system ATP-binding protein
VSEPAIAVEDLRKTYRGRGSAPPIEALRGISFTVSPGEVFALLGPNGAGKSTTVRILTTLSRATAGGARVAGFDVERAPREVRRRIGCVAQASGVDVYATGRENLQLQGSLYGERGSSLGGRVDDLLRLFQLTDAGDRLVNTWSGGMKRRLDVAMGLVHRPEVLFLDEPTTGLDPESRAVMWREVERLAAEGLTILLTTHYLEEADQLARRLAIVDAGKIVAAGTPEELKGGLRGDQVTLELRDSAALAAAESALRDAPEVDSVMRDGTTLYAFVPNGARALPQLVQAVERSGAAIAQASLQRPSLDEVYLAATGHAFRAEGQPAAALR